MKGIAGPHGHLDLDFILTPNKRIEIAFAHRIEFRNKENGVQFGFFPSSELRSSGMIRLHPNALWPMKRNADKVVRCNKMFLLCMMYVGEENFDPFFSILKHFHILLGAITIDFGDNQYELKSGSHIQVNRGKN